MLRGVQTLLSSFGIASRIYSRRAAQERSLPDGKGGEKLYPCQESFELVISRPGAIVFEKEIGLIGPKVIRLKEALDVRGRDCRRPERFITEVASIEFHGIQDVYCLNEPETNSIVVNGVVTGQCVEYSLDPHDEITGETGFGFCNTSTVNVAACEGAVDFLTACKAAAVIGTLQAGYQDLSYLTQASRNIIARDALIGVSMTGMADNPTLAFDKTLLEVGAGVVRRVNERIAALIGINTAARQTGVKPEGTGSLVLGVGNGIHPHHARRYIRHVEGGKRSDPVVQFFLTHLPEAVVTSAYNPEEVKLVFPIDLGEGKLWLKDETEALHHLDQVRSVQKSWVLPGTVRGSMSHNVSNTVVVKPHEWSEVEAHIWDNRDIFAGVSLLGSFGDLDYPQAPFVEVLSDAEIEVKYGGDPMRKDKAKAVQAQFNDLTAKWIALPWGELKEVEDNSAGVEVMACAGGQCLI
jgi:hypothetical protein